MGYYDCYCKACEVDNNKKGKLFRSQQSWVGNPDVGWVRSVAFKLKNDNIFKYMGFLYEPCNFEEYENLIYFNHEEYKEAIKDLDRKSFKRFDTVWKENLTQDEINQNGNSLGGAWRNLKTGRIISMETLP